MKKVDIVVATPSMLAPHKPSDYPNIKTVAVAGEPCPKGSFLKHHFLIGVHFLSSALADEWAFHAQFYNSCGPTEVRMRRSLQYIC